jgi:hypothetical protein
LHRRPYEFRPRIPRLFATVGFPIRKSPDQRSVGNSPKLFAATHVLHRLLAPRHPPHALSSLLTLISRSRPIRRWLVETRDQGPGLCSSQQTRLSLVLPRDSSVISCGSRLELSQQKLISTLHMQLSKNAWSLVATLRQRHPKTCGADRDRTDDIQLAKLALSQLSYSPKPVERLNLKVDRR